MGYPIEIIEKAIEKFGLDHESVLDYLIENSLNEN